jgi:hypothetical protein
MSDSYNGWTNYATWSVNLEIFDGLDLSEFFPDRPSLFVAAEWCKDYADGIIEDQAKDLALDYALAFLAEVDWHEIAEHLHAYSFPEE